MSYTTHLQATSGLNPVQMVEEFHRAAGHPCRQAKDPGYPEPAEYIQRQRLIAEEFDELSEVMGYVVQAQTDPTVTESEMRKEREFMAKEMADLLYVIYGSALALGIDLNEAFRRVHASNMTKFDGVMIKDASGKVKKGPAYTAPTLEDCV